MNLLLIKQMFNLNIINLILVFSLLPALIAGVFLTNVIFAILVIYNLFFFSKEFKIIILEEKKIILLFVSFSFILLLSSFLSSNKYHSFGSSILYSSFLIYSFSLISFFKSRSNKISFLIFSTFIFSILSIDAFYELINGKNFLGFSSIEGRIAGLFHDRWLIGRYLIYLIPLFVGIFLIEYHNISKRLRVFIFMSFLLSFFIILFSGERAAFLLLFIYFFMCLVFFFNKIKIYKIILILLFIITFLYLPFLFHETSQRMLDNFILYMTSIDIDKNPYYTMWHTALNIFRENPFFGSGPNNFRIYCSRDLYYISELSCSTHPHNIVFQLLSEIGIIGFSFILIFLIYNFNLLLKLILIKNFTTELLGCYSLLLAPFIQLFPFMISGNFFLSWYGIIYYLSISFLLIYKKNIFKFIK